MEINIIPKLKLLFVCNAGLHRSATAAEIYAKKGYETKSAGCWAEGERFLTEEKLEWADIIICMKEEHRKWIADNHPKEYMMKKIITLDIPDVYRVNQEELVVLLRKSLSILK
ncbi:MAG: phosphotyrosine protein phosphatase [Nanoarchaeota archaeon]|nr:phosphotyrosine protein phosphatase [Nanoarchaeota archaeon]MBU1030452.1 phosphotyrosine protein phosphatase [Nanoarchaeota archaeon]